MCARWGSIDGFRLQLETGMWWISFASHNADARVCLCERCRHISAIPEQMSVHLFLSYLCWCVRERSAAAGSSVCVKRCGLEASGESTEGGRPLERKRNNFWPRKCWKNKKNQNNSLSVGPKKSAKTNDKLLFPPPIPYPSHFPFPVGSSWQALFPH